MEHLEYRNTKEIKLEKLIKKLESINFHLKQETNDKIQLSPQERIVSIQNVWDTVKTKLGNPKTALDVGSGFAYGTVFLDMNNIQTIGIENVHSKNTQAIELFRKLDITLNKINEIDFSKSPAILEIDFNKLKSQKKCDLITMFYLSGKLVTNPQTFQICKRILKKEGKIMLSTEEDIITIKKIISNKDFELPNDFSFEIINVPNNFEKTAIILSKQN